MTLVTPTVGALMTIVVLVGVAILMPVVVLIGKHSRKVQARELASMAMALA
jgi:hypothetical protein